MVFGFIVSYSGIIFRSLKRQVSPYLIRKKGEKTAADVYGHSMNNDDATSVIRYYLLLLLSSFRSADECECAYNGGGHRRRRGRRAATAAAAASWAPTDTRSFPPLYLIPRSPRKEGIDGGGTPATTTIPPQQLLPLADSRRPFPPARPASIARSTRGTNAGNSPAAADTTNSRHRVAPARAHPTPAF